MLRLNGPYRINERRIAKWQAAGRGTGVGAGYNAFPLIGI
jgi:hypothetical protein